MAHNTEIITSTEVRDQVINSVQFDVALLENRIINYQRKYVRKVLGKDFYDEILTQVEGASLTADNNTLLESYIKPMLAHYIVFEEMPYLRSQIGSLGSRNPLDDLSGQADDQDYGLLRRRLSSDADLMKQNLIQYIKDEQEDDSSKYPLFEGCEDSNNSKYFITY
jgi:hypothetical protein